MLTYNKTLQLSASDFLYTLSANTLGTIFF